MHESSSINASRSAGLSRTRAVEVAAPDPKPDPIRTQGQRGSDRVEFSTVARYLAELKAGTPERTDLINKVRAEIESGAYETDEKLNSAVEGLAEDLGVEID